jgi:hypothetical protein
MARVRIGCSSRRYAHEVRHSKIRQVKNCHCGPPCTTLFFCPSKIRPATIADAIFVLAIESAAGSLFRTLAGFGSFG